MVRFQSLTFHLCMPYGRDDKGDHKINIAGAFLVHFVLPFEMGSDKWSYSSLRDSVEWRLYAFLVRIFANRKVYFQDYFYPFIWCTGLKFHGESSKYLIVPLCY